MSPDRTCKRCSVARVNALIKAYAQAHANGTRSRAPLRQLVQLASDRGFHDAGALLHPGLNSRELRAVCWNVSSFLEDPEVETALGIKL